MAPLSSISVASSLVAHPLRSRPTPAASLGAEADLTGSEKKQVDEMKQVDADVRRHEQAHLAAAGPYGKGPPQYTYETGPDGKQYAVGGHVEIDTEEVKGDPKATLEKARVIKRAALAPREPSAQDRKVAQEAEQMAQKAQRELREPSGTEEDRKSTSGQASRIAGVTSGYTQQGHLARGLATPPRLNVYA